MSDVNQHPVSKHLPLQTLLGRLDFNGSYNKLWMSERNPCTHDNMKKKIGASWLHRVILNTIATCCLGPDPVLHTTHTMQWSATHETSNSGSCLKPLLCQVNTACPCQQFLQVMSCETCIKIREAFSDILSQCGCVVWVFKACHETSVRCAKIIFCFANSAHIRNQNYQTCPSSIEIRSFKPCLRFQIRNRIVEPGLSLLMLSDSCPTASTFFTSQVFHEYQKQQSAQVTYVSSPTPDLTRFVWLLLSQLAASLPLLYKHGYSTLRHCEANVKVTYQPQGKRLAIHSWHWNPTPL